MTTRAKRTALWLRYAAVLTFLGSGLTCFIGPRYTVSQLPAAQRGSMTDTDWIGVEWIGAGMVLLAIAVTLMIAAVVMSRRAKRTGPD